MERHYLEDKYGLTAYELLDALDKRFRAKVTLEGAVAEVQMEKHINALVGSVIDRYTSHDRDGYPDFSIWLPGRTDPLLAECKNVRDADEAYRSGGEIVAYKVETQKTRAATGDPTSRYYGVDQFHILGVCLGKKTDNWSDFMFIKTSSLETHKNHDNKLATMQRVPLLTATEWGHWKSNLGEILRDY